MQIKGEQSGVDLEQALQAVYVVYGDEPLLVLEAGDAIRSAARRNGFDEREVLTVIPGFNWIALHHVGGQYVAVRLGVKLDRPAHSDGKPGREGSLV